MESVRTCPFAKWLPPEVDVASKPRAKKSDAQVDPTSVTSNNDDVFDGKPLSDWNKSAISSSGRESLSCCP